MNGEVMKALGEYVADPTNRSPLVLYLRALEEMSAEGSAGHDSAGGGPAGGRVVAKVDGFGILKSVRIAPALMSDVPRLEELVREAFNLAKLEAGRQRPPVPRLTETRKLGAAQQASAITSSGSMNVNTRRSTTPGR